MRIAVLIPLKSQASGGVVKRVNNLLPRWLQDPRVNGVTVFTARNIIPGLEDLGIPVIRSQAGTHQGVIRDLGSQVRAGGFDVVMSVTARPLPVNRVPLVTTVCNIEPIQKASYRMPLRWRLRLWALRRENRAACEQASLALAVSQYVKDEVCREFKIRPDKIRVVYPGFHPATPTETRPINLPANCRRFFFSAGGIFPYRGFEDVVRAIAAMRSQGKEAPCMVIAGSGHALARPYEKWVRRLSTSLECEQNFFWAGQLSAEQMAWCYQNAVGFVQTSRAESFSNVQVEAMGQGSMVISCDQQPMPEILSEAAQYYPTGDSERLASRMLEALNLPESEAQRRRTKSKERAAFFSWDKCARETLELLESAIGQSNGDR